MSSPSSFCPYVGLVPYTEVERDYFFGRERDQRIISSNLFAAPLTVLYGASGVGKSSVLLAGVVPHLRAAPRTAVVVYRQWQSPSFLSQLKSEITKAVELENKKPITIDESLPLDDFLFSAVEAFGGSILIIFDQFEEYFLYHPETEKDNNFDVEFACTVNREEVDANFLLVLRDDGLSKLDRFRARIPNMLGNSLRLHHLDAKAAEDAIRRPLEVHNTRLSSTAAPMEIEDELVQVILTKVQPGQVQLGKSTGAGQAEISNGKVQIETPFLQLVLTRMWDEEREKDSNILRLSTFEDLGGAQEIVRSHLDTTMETFSVPEKEVCAKFFDRLVTPTGNKIACAVDDINEWAGDLANHVPSVLKILSNPDARILRTVAPPSGQPEATRYEIFHDVLGSAVLTWQARYVREKERAEEKKQAAIEAAEREKEIARQRELEQAQALAEEQKKRAEVESQRAEDKDRVASRFFRLAAALAVVFLVAVVAAIFAFKLKETADQARTYSLAERDKADSLRVVADANAVMAIAAADSASKSRAEAEAERDRADSLRLVADDNAARAIAAAKIAEKAQVEAEVERDRADSLAQAESEARIKAENLQNDIYSFHFSYLIQTLPQLSQLQFQRGNTELAALLARQAYLFDERTGGNYQSDVYEALLTALNAEAFNANETSGGPKILEGHTNWVRSVAFHPNGSIVASASEDSTVRLWDLQQDNVNNTVLSGHAAGVRSLAFSSNGKILASGSDDNTIRLWNISNSEPPFKVLEGHNAGVWAVAFSPNDSLLASGGADSTVVIWNCYTQDPAMIDSLKHPSRIRALAFSPDGTVLFTGSEDGNIRLWDLFQKDNKYKLLGEIKAHSGTVNSIAFCQTGDTLASGGEDAMVRLWRIINKKNDIKIALLDSLRGHNGPVNSVAFSPTYMMLASGSSDRSVRLWDLHKLENKPVVLRAHGGFVWSVALSADGETLVSGAQSYPVYVWCTRTEILADRVCENVARNLSQEEWENFIGVTIEYECTCPGRPPCDGILDPEKTGLIKEENQIKQ